MHLPPLALICLASASAGLLALVVVEDDGCAVVREVLGDGGAEAARASGDDGDFILQVIYP